MLSSSRADVTEKDYASSAAQVRVYIQVYIYSIKSKEDREKWIQALRQKKKKRYPRKTNRLKTGKIPNRTSIHERPPEIEGRTEGGHWEGDLIIGKNHGSAIGTIVERCSRLVKIVPLNEGKTSRINEPIMSCIKVADFSAF